MESYIVRIYRRDDEHVSGLVINAADGTELVFQNLQQLVQRLDINNIDPDPANESACLSTSSKQ